MLLMHEIACYHLVIEELIHDQLTPHQRVSIKERDDDLIVKHNDQSSFEYDIYHATLNPTNEIDIPLP